ncbi:hypothetical protein PROFUN_04482 [Planoprotostelium fungivorum]|uniref:C2 domain-containing protein n=1 Tax=Planoprotostelium fungivorum TaxID=1890364 RepID=A0A2P6NVQ9_9EUKA|nr:hypothetical protein PROFUN_04482 [Planoprotostelium fungivorum]
MEYLSKLQHCTQSAFELQDISLDVPSTPLRELEQNATNKRRKPATFISCRLFYNLTDKSRKFSEVGEKIQGFRLTNIVVIEAREVVSRIPAATVHPGVVVKYIGGGSTQKKGTGYKSGKTYWAEIFTFPVDNVHNDGVTFQLREKGYHVVSSDWLGEVTLKLSDYDDGNVHLKWFRLGNAKSKQHTKSGKGVLLLKIHLTTRNDKPFYKKPCERQLSYDEWIEWSEAQYANVHRGKGTEEDYPTLDDNERQRSGSISNMHEGRDRKGDFGRNRSKSTSSAVVDRPKKEETSFEEKKLAKSDLDVAHKPRFPISPIMATPPVHKKLESSLLIDLSTPEVKKPSPVMVRKANTNPFSSEVLSLAEGMEQMMNKNLRPLTGNPFLDPTPEIARVKPHAAH